MLSLLLFPFVSSFSDPKKERKKKKKKHNKQWTIFVMLQHTRIELLKINMHERDHKYHD